MDLVLPDSQGTDTLNSLRHIDLHVSIILLTGKHHETGAIGAVQIGV